MSLWDPWNPFRCILTSWSLISYTQFLKSASDSGDMVKRQSVHNPQRKWPINAPQSEEYYCIETRLVCAFNKWQLINYLWHFFSQKLSYTSLDSGQMKACFMLLGYTLLLLLFFLLPTLSLSSPPHSLLLSPHCFSLFPLPHFPSLFLFILNLFSCHDNLASDEQMTSCDYTKSLHVDVISN